MVQERFSDLTEEDKKTARIIWSRPVEEWTIGQSEWHESVLLLLGLAVPPKEKRESQLAKEKDEISATRWALPLCPPAKGRRVIFK